MTETRRNGLWMKKVGMSRAFTPDGAHIPVTLLHLESCHVVSLLSEETAGYEGVRLAFGARKEKNVSKSVRGVYQKAMQQNKEMAMPAFSREFRTSGIDGLQVGDAITVGHFIVGQKVDVRARSKGRGFSGVIKRHNFGGLAASHGVSISHRSHGSTGHSQDPGRVFKGKKMAGQYGNRWCRVQNLEVMAVDEDNGIICLRGGVPGAMGGYVQVTDAIKQPTPQVVKQSEPHQDEAQELETQKASS